MKRFVLPTIILLALFLAGCSAGGESVTMISQMKVLNGSIYNITNNITQNFSVNITTVYNSSVANQSVACSDANSYIYNSSWVDGVQSILCASDTDTDTFNTSAEMITATNGRLNSAAGWTNTTTTTNTSLDVYITSDSPLLNLRDTGGSISWQVNSQTNDFNIQTSSSVDRRVLFKNDGSGDIILGINTALPQYALDVVGSGNFSNKVFANVSQFGQGVLTSGLSGNSILGLAGAVLVANNSTALYPGLRVNNQTGAVFNGNQYIQVDSFRLSFNESFTMCARGQKVGDDTYTLLANPTGTANVALRLQRSAAADVISFLLVNSSGTQFQIQSVFAPNDNEFYGVCGSYNQNNISLYVNGTLINSTAVLGGAQNSTAAFKVGYDGAAAKYFKGNITNAAVWNTNLSDADIASWWSGVGGGCAAVPGDPLLCYDLNKLPDIHEVYGNSSHVKDVSYLSRGEYYHLCYDDSGVLIRGCGAG